MAIDQRLVDRRKVVAEDSARRNVGRLLKLMLIVAVAGAVAWLVFSPHLSVSEVRVTGVSVSDAYRILADEDVVAGTPMVSVNPDQVEAALETDPWVADAAVAVSWPNLVLIQVSERVPAAWVETGDGWVRRAVDGVSLPSDGEPEPDMPWIQFPLMPDSEADGSAELLGALEFVTTLPESLGQKTLVRIEGDGELWAQVSGYQVRLGRAVEMREKALSLEALLRTNPPGNSVLVLVAPTHPALAPISSPDSGGEGNGGGGAKANRNDDRAKHGNKDADGGDGESINVN